MLSGGRGVVLLSGSEHGVLHQPGPLLRLRGDLLRILLLCCGSDLLQRGVLCGRADLLRRGLLHGRDLLRILLLRDESDLLQRAHGLVLPECAWPVDLGRRRRLLPRREPVLCRRVRLLRGSDGLLRQLLRDRHLLRQSLQRVH